MAAEVSELYYYIAETVIDYMELILGTVCLCLLCRDSYKEKKQLLSIGAVYFIVLVIQYHIPIYMGAMIAYAVASSAVLLTMFYWEKKSSDTGYSRFPIKVYLVLVFYSIRDLSILIAVELYTIFTKKVWEIMILRINGTTPEGWRIYFCVSIFCAVMMYAIETALIWIAVHFINKAFYDRNSRYEWKEIAILLIPSAVGLSVHLLRKAYDKLIFMEAGKETTDFYPSYSSIAVLLIVCYLISLAAVVVVFYLFQNLRKRQEEEKSRIAMQKQMQDMQSHIAEVERIYAGIRGIRHDLNNHVHVIGQLLEKEQYTQAAQYLETMQKTTEQFDFTIKTGNPVTDVIINEKDREARQKGITFHSAFSFLPDTGIDVFDISIILKNLLENAFEAAFLSNLQDKTVSIHSVRKKNAYLITVRNSCDKILSIGESGLPVSDKDNGQIHGLGLKNVRMVTEKYFGTLAIEQEGEGVTVSVMLLIV